jgi:hypothetical protein
MDLSSLNEPDLEHADWLLYTQEKLIQRVSTNISTRIVKTGEKRYLIISNITEEHLDNLQFLTNTDTNNNYLYIEQFSVYISGAPDSISIPGLGSIVLNVFRQSDATAFFENKKTHKPFDVSDNVSDFMGSTFTGSTFSEFIDEFSGLIPFAPSTRGCVKTYEIILNPDAVCVRSGNRTVCKK